MKNPIPHSSLFVTPRSLADLSEMIQDIGSSEEQRMAWLGAQMALNLSHHLVEELHVSEAV